MFRARAFSAGTAISGYIIRVHGQEFNSFRRKTRSKALHEFKLHRQEKFLYICHVLHIWEWDVRVLDIQGGVDGAPAPVCVGGRGAMWFLIKTFSRVSARPAAPQSALSKPVQP